METARLGSTGLQVSRIALGTKDFGNRLDEAQSIALLDRALDLGITFLDMGDVYPFPPQPATWGRTEEIVGRWVRGRRDEVVLATKCGMRNGTGPNAEGASRKHIVEACERSLRRLDVDCIDVLYLHNTFPIMPIEEILESFDYLVRSGKVHYVGLSNVEAFHLALAQQAVTTRNLARVAAVEISYSLVRRSPERDLLPLATAWGIGIVPYYALGTGLLAGKYTRAEGLPDDYQLFKTFRVAGPDRGIDPLSEVPAAFDVVDAVVAVAEQHDASVAQVALAWVLAGQGVSSTIVGASRPEQINDIARATTLTLSDEDMKALDAASTLFR